MDKYKKSLQERVWNGGKTDFELLGTDADQKDPELIKLSPSADNASGDAEDAPDGGISGADVKDGVEALKCWVICVIVILSLIVVGTIAGIIACCCCCARAAAGKKEQHVVYVPQPPAPTYAPAHQHQQEQER